MAGIACLAQGRAWLGRAGIGLASAASLLWSSRSGRLLQRHVLEAARPLPRLDARDCSSARRRALMTRSDGLHAATVACDGRRGVAASAMIAPRERRPAGSCSRCCCPGAARRDPTPILERSSAATGRPPSAARDARRHERHSRPRPGGAVADRRPQPLRADESVAATTRRASSSSPANRSPGRARAVIRGRAMNATTLDARSCGGGLVPRRDRERAVRAGPDAALTSCRGILVQVPRRAARPELDRAAGPDRGPGRSRALRPAHGADPELRPSAGDFQGDAGKCFVDEQTPSATTPTAGVRSRG